MKKNKEQEKMRNLFIIFILILFYKSVEAQVMKRRIHMGTYVHLEKNHIVIDSIVKNSTAGKSGLKPADIILSIDAVPVKTIEQYNNFLQQKREGDIIVIEYSRRGIKKTERIECIKKPYMVHDWSHTEYGWLATPSCTLRTITYKPLKELNKYPSVFFIPGYNCGSIENYTGNYNGKLIEQWVKAGYLVYTVEKSGNGDSYSCTPCVEADLATDIFLYENAYKQFANLEITDNQNLFIWGHSMGGIIAPIMHMETPPNGIMVFGTVFRPWSEFLLEMHRIQKPLLDSLDYVQTETFIRMIQKIYYEFFVLKKSPADLHANAEYAKLVETELEYAEGKTTMWGRHWRFWQQIDSLNLAAAWQQINANVLVLHGDADYIQCSYVEPYLISEAVNKYHNGKASMKILKGTDHLIYNSVDYHEAVKNFNNKEYMKNNFYQPLADETIEWMNAHIVR